jgi:hypothetical protein
VRNRHHGSSREKLLEFDGIVESVINNKRTNKMKYDFWMSRWVSPTWKEETLNKNRKKSDVGPREIALRQLGWAKNLPVEILEIIVELSSIGDEGCGNRFRPHQVSVDMERHHDLNVQVRQMLWWEEHPGIQSLIPEYPTNLWQHNPHLTQRNLMGVKSVDGYPFVPTIYVRGLKIYRERPVFGDAPMSNQGFAGNDDINREKHQSINNTVPRKDKTMSEHIKTVKVKRGLKGPLIKQMKNWNNLMWFINNSGAFWTHLDMFGNNSGNWNIRTIRGRFGDDWREDWDMDE